MAEKDKGGLLSEAEQILVRSRALSSRALTLCNRIVGEEDALAVEIKSLLQTIASSEKAARGIADRAHAEAVSASLAEAKAVMTGLGPGGDLRKFCKPKNPWLIRMLLGNKINLVAMRKDVSQGIREEYHTFRDRAAGIMLLGPLALTLGLAWADRHQGAAFGQGQPTPLLLLGIQFYMGWLSYFYISMALRENVLYVNGSRIRGWWIQHHYWSAAASLGMLGLPVTSPTVHHFFRGFLLWSVFQAAVMFVQNRYQRRRMYTRIALGRNTAMDVVAGESSASSGQLLLLYPMLYALQATQFAIGAGVAWRTYAAVLRPEGWLEAEAQDSDLRGMRMVFCVGLVFAYLAYRNFITTLVTQLEKRSGQSKRSSRRRAPAAHSAPAAAASPAAGAAAGTVAKPAAAAAAAAADAAKGKGKAA
ncbi:hypothetical protein HYH03_012536 [Edaphochlamys debaryana]|uniref:Uncharacterized protein n=1 Tax=Edaphochlamys debaryana TaxID=47281 RepID=A0A836BTU0_9CHLO|nr:hypothetical protein HYH03_012536 [Edaphochlamys debaryana]|eukprot:KAG2488906.1 hypothetical protein HYH03_012536 [Edaphochlamys debaryana]